MDYPPLKSVSSWTKKAAYDGLLTQIEEQEKDLGSNQYYEIKFTIAFSKDGKKTTMYCFSTQGRNSNLKEF